MQNLIETVADKEIETCLDEKQSFAVVAGAGSGKTTSLITALKYVSNSEGSLLRRDNQKVVCITYTNRAVDVISKRLDWDDLFYISTLHSFLWTEVKRLTPNIREALREEVIPAHIERKRKDDNGGQSKKAATARKKVAALEGDLAILDEVVCFEYNDTNFSNYSEGKLNHDDVIDVAAYLIFKNATLRRILGQKFPYIFVDEAQDTFSNVVAALNKLGENDGFPIVGYFGDPMQQIYDKRAGDFEGPAGAKTITKVENFRCSRKVIDLLNAFRTDVEQVPEGENAKVEGSVLFTLVQTEKPEAPRGRYSDDQLERVLTHFDNALLNWGWSDNEEVKHLFLVRQMIARRLGFSELHKLFTGIYASQKSQEDYEKGEHFLLKSFVSLLCPLVHAHKNNDVRLVLDLLRKSSPAFDPKGNNSQRSLREMKELSIKLTDEFVKLWNEASLADILEYCRDNEICKISERLAEHLARDCRKEDYDPDLHSDDKIDWLADSFLRMTTQEMKAFVDFVSKNTPLSTQHGVKGEQYKDVVVVFDDIEAGWHNYSFTKMLTPNTSGDPTEGQEERSRKLAYVCFSRAEENLRVILFTPSPENAKKELVAKGLCEESQISIVK